jgi:hypothetical protein
MVTPDLVFQTLHQQNFASTALSTDLLALPNEDQQDRKPWQMNVKILRLKLNYFVTYLNMLVVLELRALNHPYSVCMMTRLHAGWLRSPGSIPDGDKTFSISKQLDVTLLSFFYFGNSTCFGRSLPIFRINLLHGQPLNLTMNVWSCGVASGG